MEVPKIENDNDEFFEDEDPFIKLSNNSHELLAVDKIEAEEKEEEPEGNDERLRKRKKTKTRKKRKIKKESCPEKPKRPKSRLRVRYPCSKCSKIFHHIHLFNEHMLTHEPRDFRNKKIHICPFKECLREFSSLIGLKNHLNFHPSDGSGLVECSFCGKEFGSLDAVDEHQLEYHEGADIEIARSYSSPMDKIKRNAKRKKWHKCEKCDKKFGNVIIYKKHMLIHQDRQSEPYKCTSCDREFFSEHGLRVHIRNSDCNSKSSSIPTGEESANETVIENTEPLKKCPDCPKEFAGALKLDAHLVSVHMKEPQCCLCGKKFPSGSRLFRHHNVHKQPAFKCGHEGCDVSFRTKEGLLVHKRKHEGILPHICSVCGLGFPTKPKCILHRIQTHGQDLKPIVNNYRSKSRVSNARFPCPIPGCEAVFKYEQSLITHKRKHDGLLPYVCPVCQQGFPKKLQCLRHRVEVHNENMKKILLAETNMCETCGAIFKNPYTLKNHMQREHSDQKNYECDICGKKFALEYDCKVHKDYHAGAKSFTCEHCGKSFNSKGDLVRHSWSHKTDDEKPFNCQICGKGFIRNIHLNRHLKIHAEKLQMKNSAKKISNSPDEPDIYTCEYCDKDYYTKDAQRSHVRRVHGRDSLGNIVGKPKPKTYCCQHCPKVFHKKTRLVDHLKFVHMVQYEEPPKVEKPKAPSRLAETKKSTRSSRGNEERTVGNQLHTPYPVWEQPPSYNANAFHPTMPVPTQSYQSSFQNTNRSMSDCVVSNAAHMLGASSAGFHHHQPQCLYPNNTAFSNYVSTPEGHSSGQGQISHLSTTLNSTSNISSEPVNFPGRNSTVFEQTQSETIKIPANKWESIFEPEMELDDYFDDASHDATFDDITNIDTSCVKKEIVETTYYTQDKNPKLKLSEVEKSLVKKFIGSRCLSLQLKRLKTYGCKLCSLEFHKKELYDKHCRSVRHLIAIRRIKDKKFTADKSDASNELVTVAPDTIAMDDTELKQRCSICDVRFETLKLLLQHCKTKHAGQKAFPCQLCGKSYFTFKNLRHHQVTFHKEGDFVCVICKEKFQAYELYRKHITSAHKDIERKCPLCDKSFKKLKKLTDHCEAEHPGQKPFKCEICGTAYFRYKDFRNHGSRFHSEDDPAADPAKMQKPRLGPKRHLASLVCEICGKSFKQESRLRVHMTLHTGEKSHLCDLCGRSFRKKPNLVAHRQRHLGETKFLCPECGKRFYRRRDLRLHQETHAKGRPCETCGQKFTTNNLLLKHMELHDPNRPYRCSVCGFMFNHPSNLATHLRSTHPNYNYLQ